MERKNIEIRAKSVNAIYFGVDGVEYRLDVGEKPHTARETLKMFSALKSHIKKVSERA